jgi:hypothetical protein
MVRYATQIDSDEVLSRAQIRALAEEHYSTHGYIEGASSALSQRILATASPTIEVISAGKRG